MMLKPGDIAPAFTLLTHENRSFSLSAHRGHRLLLWFYPEAGTPACTLEGRSFGEQQGYFTENGITVVGISFDSVAANAAFATRNNFPFPLLSDTERTVAIAYGACDGPQARYANRVSFLIDVEGKIERVYDRVDPRDHAAQVLVDVLGL